MGGAIDVQAGGIRSTSKGSSIAVKGGKLEFSSTEPSLIGGKGITIDSAASVAVKRGTVGFTAEMLGKVAVESSAKVLLSKSSGSTCASFSGGTCKDKVEDLKLAARCRGQGCLRSTRWDKWTAVSPVGCSDSLVTAQMGRLRRMQICTVHLMSGVGWPSLSATPTGI